MKVGIGLIGLIFLAGCGGPDRWEYAEFKWESKWPDWKNHMLVGGNYVPMGSAQEILAEAGRGGWELVTTDEKTFRLKRKTGTSFSSVLVVYMPTNAGPQPILK